MKLIYRCICLIYNISFSVYEDVFLKKKKVNNSYVYTFFKNIDFKSIDITSFETKGNKYLERVVFPEKDIKVPFKKVLIAVGYAHAPGLIRFFAVTPDLVLLIVFLTQFWIFASLIISTKQILNLKSNFKAFGVVFLSFLIIAFLSISFLMSRMNAIPLSNIS